jgi:LCP family protein required for cell wall assembly
VTTLLVGATGTGYVLARRIPGNVSRVKDAFQGIAETERPTKPRQARNALNLLLVGSDTRSDEPTTGRDARGSALAGGGQRADVMMLVHLPNDRSSAAVVSIPRDSLVPVPEFGDTKINHAFAYGGPSLVITTVERLTGVRIDHFAVVDFSGFQDIVDTIGGVDVQVSQPTVAGEYRLVAGRNHLDGRRALAYVRERHALPAGDLDRTRRQQNLIRAIMTKVGTINPAREPIRTYRLLDAATKSVTVDETMTEDAMRSLSMSMLNLDGTDVAFLTAPVRGTGTADTSEGTLSVVYLDEERCAALWTALRTDTAEAYIASHRSDLLPEQPR